MKRKGITEEQYMEEIKSRQNALWFDNLRDEGAVIGLSPSRHWVISEVPETYRYEEYQGYIVTKHFLITRHAEELEDKLFPLDSISLNTDLIDTIGIYSEQIQPDGCKVIVMWKNHEGRSIKQFHVHILWLGERSDDR